MKHARPGSLALCCCVEDRPIECRVVANVPASMHGTVMALLDEPIRGGRPHRLGVEAIHPVQGMQGPVWASNTSRRDVRCPLPDIGDINAPHREVVAAAACQMLPWC